MQWQLLGAGSLGCLFAAYLRRAGVAIELLLRNDASLRQLHANGGIALSRDGGREIIAITATTLARAPAPINYLLICTKAHQTLEAVAAVQSKIAGDAIIVLLQNGMGVRESLQTLLPRATILHALSTEGAFRTARFDVTHAGHGETLIGAIDSQRLTLARQTALVQQTSLVQQTVKSLQCELPIAFAPDIERRLWLKLAVNSVINPLTAIHRCRNGELLKLDDIDASVARLCNELASVARADHIDLSAERMREEIFRVMRATAQNKSSMLQDLEAQRKTEIDFINGFIVERARARNLPCAQHEYLHKTVHALQP